MKDRPILMSGPMVCATIEDRKTETRRTRGLERINESPWNWHVVMAGPLFDRYHVTFEAEDTGDHWTCACPYGQPGDRLWVRETWNMQTVDGIERAAYRASIPNGYSFIKWKPSIFMPRWASRITLDVTSVRVERVQDITPRDVVAEGIYHEPGEWGPDEAYDHLIKGFAHLWNEINAKRGYSWEANPWVWVVGFKVLS